MSVYEFLSTPLPTIAYVILHQPRPGMQEEEYVATMREMHRMIGEESVILQSNYTRFLKEAALRESQMLRGSISQFLETPIRSDNAEVQHIFGESFEKFRDLITHRVALGVRSSSEGRFLKLAPKSVAGKKYASQSRQHLEQLGFAMNGKSARPVFESIFIVEGGQNLDVIEYLVRDKMGIYAAPHGAHLGTSNAFTFSVFNLVARHGGEWRDGMVECVVTFPKTALPYERFRNLLVEELEVLHRELGIAGSAVWQRKLGLGRGDEFAFRFHADSPASAMAVVDELLKRKDGSIIASGLHIHGTVSVKEIL